MKRNRIKRISLYVIYLLIITSCNKEVEESIPPNLTVKTGASFVSSDTILSTGNWFQIGIIAEKGSANITNLVIKKTVDGIEQIYLDSGLNSCGLDVNKVFIKGNDNGEKWTFIVMDKNRNRSSISININRDTNSIYGNLISYPLITLGAQNNPDTGGFFNLSGSIIYLLQDAYNNQEKVDMLYYYGEDANTIASPGANVETGIFTGPYGLENWNIKRETRFIKVAITALDFDQMQNDSLLISLYASPDGKRKAKNLMNDDIYFFLSPDNKLGAFKISKVLGTDNGTISILIKMQHP